jgi:small GTP-binding protein
MKKINAIGKVCLLGDGQVGKTSLIRKFVLDQFSDDYITTVGTKVSKKKLFVEFPEEEQSVDLTLTIWDILGQKEFKSLHTTFYAGASGGLIVCDLTRFDTYESMKGWIQSLFHITGEIPIVLLGNKCDLKDQHEVTEEALDNLAQEFKTIFVYTSARTGENVELAFQNLATDIVKSKYFK